MTCLLNTYGQISNIQSIINFLNVKKPVSKDDDNTYDGSDDKHDFDTEWDWKDESETKLITRTDKSLTEKSWIDKFQISMSPTGNLLVVASQRSLAICQSKWSMAQINFSINSRIDYNDTDVNELITSVCVIPIASQRKSGEGLQEWTCIIVGFDNGKIRMYTENGTLLNTQTFHEDTVLKIKCRTHEPAKYIGWIQQPEEIEILYTKNVLVCIDGNNLYHYLKAARRYTAMPYDEPNKEMMDALSGLTLDFKIWHLGNQEKLNDCASAGLTSENRFDQLFAASMIGGPNEKFESIPPISNRYITCGKSQYISFYYTIEGLSVPVFTEVKQVADKVTSALYNVAKGWMGFSSKEETTTKAKPKIEPPTFLPARFGFHDQRRKGETIIIAPGNNLAAATDSFGRVILIDMLKGIAIRIFKGYRDAQIGWICVDDETEDKNNKRYALYLIIYAPRRGLLEVWGSQQGIRVAAFNVGKESKLIFPGYYMLSLNGGLGNEQVKVNKKLQCFLIGPNGMIKVLQIPFHLILSDISNQRVRDTILLKKFKTILREGTSDNENIWSNLQTLLKEFKTDSIKQQAFERLVNTTYLSPSKIHENIHQQCLSIQKNGSNLNKDTMKLYQFCQFNCQLISSYIFVESFGDKSTEEKAEASKSESLNELLHIDQEDVNTYYDLKNKQNGMMLKNPKHRKVNFLLENTENEMDLAKFLSCFELQASNNSVITSKDDEKNNLNLCKNLTHENKQLLGKFIFAKLLDQNYVFNESGANQFIKSIPLDNIVLLDLLVVTWLVNSYENICSLYKFISILSGFRSENYKNESIQETSDEKQDAISTVAESEAFKSDFEILFVDEYLNRFKMFVESISILNLTSGLLVTWIFRSLIHQSENKRIQLKMLDCLSEKIFTLIKFNCLLLVGNKQLDATSINLRGILSKGKGVLSEILAKQIVLNEIPQKLLNFIDEEEEDTEDGIVTTEKDDPKILLKDDIFNDFYNELQETRKYLPQSLEPDILLSNSTWEAVNLFNRNFEADVNYLKIALRYCSEIGNSILKQGILSMIWHQFLVKKVSLLTNLVEKIGKIPKDKQLRKEVGLNEGNVLKFIECVQTVLDLIMDANCSINEVPIFMFDQFWNDSSDSNDISTMTFLSLTSTYYNEHSKSEKVVPSQSKLKQLVEIAAEQKHVNYFLCLFHSQLIRILYLTFKYHIKSVKPFAFFDTKGKHTLFSELHTHPLINNDVDIKIISTRKLFFTKSMNAIMSNVEMPTSTKSKLPKEVDENFNTVFNLSKDMGVDVEFIKGYYCCMLYALDYHNEAEKILRTIKEVELVACQLLVVVGYKVNKILASMNFDANLVSILSTNLTSWLKCLGDSEYKIFTLPSKQPILELMDNVMLKLSDSFSEYKIAVELFDFIDNPQFQLKE